MNIRTYPTALALALDMIQRMDNRHMAKTLEQSLSVHCHWQPMVESFHLFYKQPLKRNLPDTELSHMDDERLKMRLELIKEEVEELIEASGTRNVLEMADAIGDIIYVCVGLAIEMGIPIGAVLKEIHASNLTKADENGNPILREDGKVLKGPNYMKPQLHKVLLLNTRRNES